MRRDSIAGIVLSCIVGGAYLGGLALYYKIQDKKQDERLREILEKARSINSSYEDKES